MLSALGSLNRGSLSSMLIMAGFLHDRRSTSLELAWRSPKHGQGFLAGHIIQAEWTAKKSIISPSFCLCVQSDDDSDSVSRRSNGDDDSCGDSVWPSVEHDGDSYTASLMAPNITQDQVEMYLRIRDDFGNEATSPLFMLNSTTSAGLDTLASSEGNSGITLGNTSSHTTASTASDSPKKSEHPSSKHPITTTQASEDKADPSSSFPTMASGDETTGSPTSSPTSPISSPTSPTSSTSDPPDSDAISPVATPTPSPDSPDIIDSAPQLNLSKPSTSSAAILAVPLSLLGLILIASSILACHHHRRTVRARNADRDRLERSASFVAATAALKAHESLRAARIEVPRRSAKRMELDDIISLYEYDEPARWTRPDALGIYHPTWGAPIHLESSAEKEVFHDVPLTPRLPRSAGYAAGLSGLAGHDLPLPPPPALIPGMTVRPRPR